MVSGVACGWPSAAWLAVTHITPEDGIPFRS